MVGRLPGNCGQGSRSLTVVRSSCTDPEFLHPHLGSDVPVRLSLRREVGSVETESSRKLRCGSKLGSRRGRYWTGPEKILGWDVQSWIPTVLWRSVVPFRNGSYSSPLPSVRGDPSVLTTRTVGDVLWIWVHLTPVFLPHLSFPLLSRPPPRWRPGGRVPSGTRSFLRLLSIFVLSVSFTLTPSWGSLFREGRECSVLLSSFYHRCTDRDTTPEKY